MGIISIIGIFYTAPARLSRTTMIFCRWPNQNRNRIKKVQTRPKDMEDFADRADKAVYLSPGGACPGLRLPNRPRGKKFPSGIA